MTEHLYIVKLGRRVDVGTWWTVRHILKGLFGPSGFSHPARPANSFYILAVSEEYRCSQRNAPMDMAVGDLKDALRVMGLDKATVEEVKR